MSLKPVKTLRIRLLLLFLLQLLIDKILLIVQEELIGKGATSLLSLYREPAFNTPNQLYNDVQSTLIDTIYCIAKQIDTLSQSFYTAFNATDPKKRFWKLSNVFWT